MFKSKLHKVCFVSVYPTTRLLAHDNRYAYQQLKKMSVFRFRKGWRNDVQQDALINMPDRT